MRVHRGSFVATSATLHDGTTGWIDSHGTTMCKGATGYDGPTGVGTRNGLNAF
jgi:hypothetical protein